MFGVKTMTPSRLQVPPPGNGAAASTWGGPPDASIFFSLASAKNPRNRLSGDQNGNVAPSVPASDRGFKASSSRIQSDRLSSTVKPTNAIRLPSGETASDVTVS